MTRKKSLLTIIISSICVVIILVAAVKVRSLLQEISFSIPTHSGMIKLPPAESADSTVTVTEEPKGAEGVEREEVIDWSKAYAFPDPKGDFWLGDGSPPQVIKFPPVDIIKTYITNDDRYLYLKFEMNGIIPTLPLPYNSDTVRILTLSCVIDTDQNKSTGKVMNYAGGDLALDAFFGSPPQAGGKLYTFINYYTYDPDAPEGTGQRKSGTLLAGGVGKNFVTLRFSLSGLNLEKGMRVNIFPWAEAESDLYHHFARDVALPEGQWYPNIEIR